MYNQKRNTVLKYAIRKGKIGVSSIAVAAMLCGFTVSTLLNTGSTVAFAQEQTTETTNNQDEKFEKLLENTEFEKKLLDATKAYLESVPQTPDGNTDYAKQKELWKTTLENYKKQAQKFEEIKKQGSEKLPELETLYKELFDTKYRFQVEYMTRTVYDYRQKYPNNKLIKKIFNETLKQTAKNHYGSYTGETLKNYVKNTFEPAFLRIQKITENIHEQRIAMKTIKGFVEEFSSKPKSKELIEKLSGIMEDLKKVSKEKQRAGVYAIQKAHYAIYEYQEQQRLEAEQNANNQ